MPAPSTSLATLRPELGSFMELDAAAMQRGFIGLRVFPVLEVGKQSGSFGRVTIESLLSSRTTLRAPGGGYNRQKWQFEEDSYACVEHGAEEPIDDREAQMYADFFDAETIATLRARDAVLTNHEIRVKDLLFDTSGLSGQITDGSGAPWDTPNSGTPITHVKTAVEALYDRGIMANAVVMSWKAYRSAINTDEVQAVIAASGAGAPYAMGRVNESVLAELFDVDYVIVGGKQRNTADEGQAASLSSIIPDGYVAVTRVAETNDIREPCVGRTFHWGEDGSTIGGLVESYRDETVRSDIIRCRMDTDEKRLYSEAIQLIDIDA